MKRQLFKIGVEDPAQVKNITWKTAKAFFQTHLNSILTSLKSIPGKLQADEQKDILCGLSVVNSQK